MTFIVVFVSLIIERFFDWSHLRIWHWFTDFQRVIIKKWQQKSAYLNLFISIAPILLGVSLVEYVLSGWIYGFPKLVFEIFVLLYSFGPQNLWADSFGCINAVAEGDAQSAAVKLKNAFGMNDVRSAQSLHRKLLTNIFVAANRRVFAVLFWYMVLGPMGAIFYRLIAVSSGIQEGKFDTVPALSRETQTLEAILDWLPARIITFFFALGGQFTQVLACWRKYARMGMGSSDQLMSMCGMAALGAEDETRLAADCSMERSAISLLDRSLVMVLVVVALVVLV